MFTMFLYVSTDNNVHYIVGDAVIYTNWEGGHRDHTSEDCAVLQPAKNGTWDDRDCDSGFLGLSHEGRYYGFCEFGKNIITGADDWQWSGNGKNVYVYWFMFVCSII